jgi:DNA-directed RNA polymerase subunit RPC12/RpoP
VGSPEPAGAAGRKMNIYPESFKIGNSQVLACIMVSPPRRKIMNEQTFLCQSCRHTFKLSVEANSSEKSIIQCPKCGNFDVTAAPCWAPLDSGSNIFNQGDWKYECQQCSHKFIFPIPKSPSEEKTRRCPACQSGHLHLLTDIGAQPLYCG